MKFKYVAMFWLSFTPLAGYAADCVPGVWQSPPDMKIFDPHNGAMPVQVESEHFQLRWPANKPNHMTAEQAQLALKKLESAWSFFTQPPVNWPEPFCDVAIKVKTQVFTDDNYPFNGSGAGQRTPAMWVHKNGLINGTAVLAHEFTHTMQYASEGMRSSAFSGWMWESHAEFMAMQYHDSQFGDNRQFAGCVGDYAWQPHLYYGSTRNRYCSWPFWLYVKNQYGWNAVNDIFTNTRNIYSQDPVETLMKNQGWTAEQLGDAFGNYAMRNVNWDYRDADGFDHGPKFKAQLGLNTDMGRPGDTIDGRKRLRLARLEPIDLARKRFVVSKYFAPQRYGYNLVKLVPDAGAGSVTVNFRGVVQDQTAVGAPGSESGSHDFEPGWPNRGDDVRNATVGFPDSDWRWGVVAIEASGASRYSALMKGAKADLTFALKPDDREVYMVVVAAPKEYKRIFWDQKYNTIYRYPWKVQLAGALPDGFQPGYDPKFPAGRRHPNGGGWVANGAQVDATAYVGPNAAVLGGEVRDFARIEDYAIVWKGVVKGMATIGGLTQFGSYGARTATDNAVIRSVTGGPIAFGDGGPNGVFGGDVYLLGDLEVWAKDLRKGVFYGWLDQAFSERPEFGADRNVPPVEVTAEIPRGWPDLDPLPPAGQAAPRFGGWVFGNKNFSYSGSWVPFENWSPNAGGDIHGTPLAGNYAEFRLTGYRVAIYGGYANDAGIMDVYLDGNKVASVNQFRQYRGDARAYNQVLWDSGVISNGNHVVRLVSTGNKSAESLNSWVHIDEVEVAVNPLAAKASKPTISIAPGTYFQTPGMGRLNITSTTPGAVIRYTLDGSDPTVRSPILNGAISICNRNSVRVKAIAEANGFRLSDVTDASYTVIAPWFSPGCPMY